jgi:hypothetical protein
MRLTESPSQAKGLADKETYEAPPWGRREPMPKRKAKAKAARKEERLSLYPLDFKDVIKAMLQTKPMPKKGK